MKRLLPFVDACQMSTTALAMGAPVSAHVTLPCMKATWPSGGVSKVMVLPFGRVGASARQKGPRMADAVTGFPLLAAARYVMLSTRLRGAHIVRRILPNPAGLLARIMLTIQDR